MEAAGGGSCWLRASEERVVMLSRLDAGSVGRNTGQRQKGEGVKGSVVSIRHVRREFWNTGLVR